MKARIGTAGWAIPAATRSEFGDGPSSLARYATRFGCVEINSSFHRRHRPDTWARWAEAVPASFRFSIKLPKTMTHGHRLADCDALMAEFTDDIAGLGAKLAVVLVQLPPSLAHDRCVAPQFFRSLASLIDVQIVCEARHATWFDGAADAWMIDQRIARVAADPAVVPEAADPGGWTGFAYWRLHGSPHIYRSSYEADALAAYGRAIARTANNAWCIFDNTASSAATANALDLSTLLETAQGTRSITPDARNDPQP